MWKRYIIEILMRNFGIIILSVVSVLLFSTATFAISEPFVFSIPTPTPTVEYALPYPGLLPDHPLYFLKALRDKMLLFFTRDPVRKINITLLLSDKRLVMGQLLLEKGNTDLSISTFNKAEKYLLDSSRLLVAMKKNNNLPPGLADKVELAAKKHEEIITNVMRSITDETKKQELNQALGINHQATQQIQLTK